MSARVIVAGNGQACNGSRVTHDFPSLPVSAVGLLQRGPTDPFAVKDAQRGPRVFHGRRGRVFRRSA